MEDKENEKGQIRRLLAWDWGGLLCFEAAHKLIGFLVLLPLFRSDYAQWLQNASLQALARRDLTWMLQSPRALAAGAAWAAVFVYYFYLESVFLALYCDRAWKRERSSLQRLAGQAVGQALALFLPRNLPLLLGLLALLPAGCWIFYGNLGLAGQGLDYLGQRLGGWVWALWLPSLAALAVLGFCFFFGFHLLAVERRTVWEAWKISRKALRNRKRRVVSQLLRQTTPLALALLLLYLIFVIAIVSLANLFWQGEEAAAVFRLYYLRWSKLLRAGTFAAGSCVFSALAVSLFYRFQGKSRPTGGGAKRLNRSPLRRIRLTAAAAGLAALAIFSETELGGQTLYWTEHSVQVVAHRGGAQLAPENTLEALEAARESGADLAEIDVRQTGDGVPVLLHDASLRRTHGLKTEIWDLNFSQLSDMAPEPPIPSLAQAVRLADKEMGLMIELKLSGWDRSLAERTAAILRWLQAEQTCSVASMDLDMLARVKQIAPELKTIYIASVLRPEDYDLDYLDGYSLRYNFLTPAATARLRRQGKEVYAWTVNTQRSIQWALYCQPDGIITDNPYLAHYFMESGRENNVLEFWTGLFDGEWADPIFHLD